MRADNLHTVAVVSKGFEVRDRSGDHPMVGGKRQTIFSAIQLAAFAALVGGGWIFEGRRLNANQIAGAAMDVLETRVRG